MKIKETMYQKVAVLSLRGNLMGPPESDKLFENVKGLIEDGVTRVVFDLKHVNWINSLGVGSIMKCFMTLKEAKGSLHLVSLTEKVRSIFVMSQLTKVFVIHEKVEQAVEQLNNT